MGYSFVKLKFKEQLQYLHSMGYVYVLRQRSAKDGTVGIYYGSANIGYGSAKVVGRIAKRNGKIYVLVGDDDLIPIEHYHVFTGLDEETWVNHVKKKLSSNPSRIYLVKVTLIKAYTPLYMLIEEG